MITQSHSLTEDFIEKHKDKIDWFNITIYQKLNEQFIEKYKNDVYWYNILKYQRLSDDYIKKYKLCIPEDSWMYKDKKYKKEKIKNTELYEIKGDDVYAYKAIRKNYCSVFNFQYLYEIGKVYESHADYNPENIDSFGLSAWTYEGARQYYDRGRILKIKIGLDDIACLIEPENKLRCSKITIINEIQ